MFVHGYLRSVTEFKYYSSFTSNFSSFFHFLILLMSFSLQISILLSDFSNFTSKPSVIIKFQFNYLNFQCHLKFIYLQYYYLIQYYYYFSHFNVANYYLIQYYYYFSHVNVAKIHYYYHFSHFNVAKYIRCLSGAGPKP